MNSCDRSPVSTSPSTAPTLLTSHRIQSKASKPRAATLSRIPEHPFEAATSNNTIYITKQLSVPLRTAKENGKWVVAQRKFNRDFARLLVHGICEVGCEAPEIGACRIFKAKYPDLGLVKTKEKLLTHSDDDHYYEHEYHLSESTLLPGVQGFIGKLTIFADEENPGTSIAIYRASWESGEVSDFFKAACKDAINGLDSQPEAWEQEPENTVGSAIYLTKHLSLPLEQARAKGKWAALTNKFSCIAFRAHIWGQVAPEKLDCDVSQIGDCKIFEAEYAGFGFAKTTETLLKYEDCDKYYEHEYHTESTVMPGIQGYIATVTIFSDSEHPKKSIVTYRARWESGEVTNAFRAACKAAINSIDASADY